ncbi:MAG: metallophosphoesterase family protein [Bacteroidota bacterium]|nr:metallophosphoesterase family protein [Bacteroidota bacterium]
MKRIGLISDTHGFFDEKVTKYFESCDEIWHAGDIGNKHVIDKLSAIKPIKAVYGNIDGVEINSKYPENLFFEIENTKVLITHIGGKPGKYPSRVKKLLTELKPDIYMCGHSHMLQIQSDPLFNNLLFINPGAAGNEGFHKTKTIMTFELENKKVNNMKVIELGKRGL